ncbi:hypothetical protein BDV98DRAFT_35798 [Pterulicium gracile]|uniref:Secreted protein n=1 Tax=Pterulicium gracile TaxID=1884261 RepID=A0A5C3R409_9AGAR|nr:hypothetical protein BDV98DRAFT_35798 [Pterula gracilis]
MKLTSLLVVAAAAVGSNAAYCCTSPWKLRSSTQYYIFCDQITSSCAYSPQTGLLLIDLGSPAWKCPARLWSC